MATCGKWSMICMTIWATVVVIVGPPGEPTIARSLPSLTMIVGVMLDSMRLPGSMPFCGPWTRPNMLGAPTFAVKSSISLFRVTPVPGTMTLEPKPPLRVKVLDTALPH